MKDIIIFGIQGSGKGTQSKLLLDEHPDTLSYFSSGDVFRALQSVDNAIGLYVKERLHKGELIDDNVTNALFEAYFYTLLHDKKAMLLDGYPRSMPQMEDIMKLVWKRKRDILGIQFVVSDEVAIQRIKMRGRHDDTDDAIKHRITQFYERTMPMITYFANKAPLVKINAERPIPEVAAEVAKLVHG